MTDEDVNKLRIVIKEEVTSVVKEELKPINEKLDALWDQTVELTDLNQTNDNIVKIDKRLTEAENHLGIVPLPELTLVR